MFEDTKHWLKGKDNHLLLVLDEAHLYQGALGTEVGYLIRSFWQAWILQITLTRFSSF